MSREEGIPPHTLNSTCAQQTEEFMNKLAKVLSL